MNATELKSELRKLRQRFPDSKWPGYILLVGFFVGLYWLAQGRWGLTLLHCGAAPLFYWAEVRRQREREQMLRALGLWESRKKK